MESSSEQGGTRRRKRRRRRSLDQDSLRNWAKDDVPEGDPHDERNLGIVVAVAVGLVVLLLVAYVMAQMKYEAPF
jgi:hypothetical protein